MMFTLTLLPFIFSSQTLIEKTLSAEKQYLQSLNSSMVDYSIYDVDIGNSLSIHTLQASQNITKNISILLLHGFTGALGHWKDIIPHLTSEGYQVYAIDLLGWGLSSRPTNQFSNWEWLNKKPKTVEDVSKFWSDSIEEWRKKEGINRLHVVGHSLGGWVAGEYAQKYPKKVVKLTLANSVGVYPKDPSWFNGDAGYFMEKTRYCFGINWPFRLLRFIDWLFPSILGNSDRSNYIRAYNKLPPSGEIITEYIRRRSNPTDDHTLWNRLPSVTYPVHLIYSEKDHTVPSYQKEIINQLNHSSKIDVTVLGMNTGHTPTTPEQFETIGKILSDNKEEYVKLFPNRINYTITYRNSQ